ncbi:hypothetical protein [Actinoplanes subglobosus]|uniref:Uncharacterized protein n=1 Tax=Actinoplanes subglobosus TaxID=1547892 RepID=A0ABV8IS51_9ACTN
MSHATFGKQATYVSTETCELAVSDDRRAFTLTFADLVAEAGTDTSAHSFGMHTFSMVLPLDSAPDTVQIRFSILETVIVSEAGAGATVVFSVNGQTDVMHFPPGSDDLFTQVFDFESEPTAELRISFFLLADRESGNPSAFASITTGSLDASILPLPV